MDVITQTIPEAKVEGMALGRHVEHDPRSRAFAVEEDSTVKIQSVTHKRHGTIFNQGNLGSCTGNASAGACNTEPFYTRDVHPLLHEADAVKIYEEATILDGFPGQYPPDDTGSSGLAAAKALQQRKFISSYKHAFSLHTAIQALMGSAFIMGINWYEGFDTPDPVTGEIKIAGQVRGGHELCVREYEMVGTLPSSLDYIWPDNSWGTGWGLKGRCKMTLATLEVLLGEQGDITILVP